MNKPSRDWLIVAEDGDISALDSFLSGKPMHTREVRDAIVRILHSDWDTLGIGRSLISILFDSEQWPKEFGRPAWTVSFKRTGKGQSNEWANLHIAMAVQTRRDRGKSYEKAIEQTAENIALSERQVARFMRSTKINFPGHDIRQPISCHDFRSTN